MNNVIVYWQAGIPNHRAFFFLQRAWEKEEANSVQVDVDIKWGAQAFKKKKLGTSGGQVNRHMKWGA